MQVATGGPLTGSAAPVVQLPVHVAVEAVVGQFQAVLFTRDESGDIRHGVATGPALAKLKERHTW